MTKIYRYILASDTGMAPCPTRGLITLATCKPQIRRSAKAGDWVIGLMPSRFDRGLVAWAGQVEQVIPIDKYERLFRGRADAIYRVRPDGEFDVLRPDYHSDLNQRLKDQSAPVLVFAKGASWYFGATPRLLPKTLIHLADAARYNRVNGTEPGDETRLAQWLSQWTPGIHGKPRNPELDKPCGSC